MTRAEVLQELTAKFLNDEGRRVVGDYLSFEEEDLAAIVILGGIDSLVCSREISDDDARFAYEQLGIERDEMVRLRNENKELWE